jgi:hypothetical protein
MKYVLIGGFAAMGLILANVPAEAQAPKKVPSRVVVQPKPVTAGRLNLPQRPAAQPVASGLVPNNSSRLLSNPQGGRLLANDGAGLINPGNRAGIVAGGAGNLISTGNRAGIVAGGAGNMRSR